MTDGELAWKWQCRAEAAEEARDDYARRFLDSTERVAALEAERDHWRHEHAAAVKEWNGDVELLKERVAALEAERLDLVSGSRVAELQERVTELEADNRKLTDALRYLGWIPFAVPDAQADTP